MTLPIGPVLAATMLTQALTTLGVLALAAVAPRAAADIGVPAALVGYQVSIVYAGAMVAALLGGAFVRRFGATATSQLALWLVAAGSLLSLAGSLPAMALGAVVIGLGYGLTNPAASHLLARAPTSRNMNLLFSLKQSGVPVGGMLAGFIMPPLTLAFGWRVGVVTCVALMLALSAALELRRRAWDADASRGAALLASPLASLRIVWRHDILRWISISSFAYSAVQLSLTTFLVTYLVLQAELDLLRAGSVLSLTHAAGAAGRLFWGWLADRLRSGSLALAVNGALSILGALGTCLIATSWPLWAIAATCMFFGFCAMGWNGVFVAVVARQAPPGEIGTATGGSLVITYAGILAGPAALAAAHERFALDYDTGFALLGLASALGVAAVLRARHYVSAGRAFRRA
ncbi:MAG: MFS transporter [Betaproteobacteria bacterium]